MKAVAILLVTAMALPAFAGKKQVTITVDEAVSQKSIHQNFDGSITIIEPRVLVGGEKLKIFSTERGLDAVNVAQFHPEVQRILDANQRNTLFYDDAQSIKGICKAYGKPLVIDATFSDSFWGKEVRAILNEDGLLDSVNTAHEGRTSGMWLTSVTCR